MSDSTNPVDWYDKAKTDLQSAEILFENGGANNTIAFLCQQNAEKMMKGYLLELSGQNIHTHSLRYLTNTISDYDNSFSSPETLKECALLNQFYMSTRYPSKDRDIILNVNDSETWIGLNIAQNITETISQNSSLLLQEKDEEKNVKKNISR